MKVCLSFCISLSLLGSCLVVGAAELAKETKSSPEIWLIQNGDSTREFPKNFRTEHDKLKSDSVSTKGLDRLNASGSAEFTAKQLQSIKDKLAKYKIIDVDLRQESHGFIDGEPYSWFSGENQINRGKTLAEIENDEKSRLEKVGKEKQATVFRAEKSPDINKPKVGKDPHDIEAKSAETEKKLCEENGIGYVRIPVADYHCPEPQQVDQFVDFVKSLPAQAKPPVWLHFHCAAGRGRTTTFLAMYDMMKNADKVKLSDIIERQRQLGGVDLADLNQQAGFKRPYTVARTHFVTDFYDYCQDQAPKGFAESYSKWIEAQNKR